MLGSLTEYVAELTEAQASPPRKRGLLPPAILIVVFAMVVTAVAGFAYVSSQQQALTAVRGQSEDLRVALQSLTQVDADLGHYVLGDKLALTSHFRQVDLLKLNRGTTLDKLAPPLSSTIDQLLADWADAASLAVNGDVVEARSVLASRGTSATVARIADTATLALDAAAEQFSMFEDRIRLGTLAVLLLQVLGGTLAMSGLIYAFRSSAAEAQGRSAALTSADTSREQVSRLFEMADVLQSATDYADANAVLRATVSDLVPGFSGALYVFNNSRDRLVLSTSWGRLDDEKVLETIAPDQCWALKRGKPHLNHGSGSKLCCEHHHGNETALEIPMIARGEIMGLFQLFASGADAQERLAAVTGLGTALADGMSLALANMALREKLRNQALRDPLTGLYNRRYMEDTLARFVRLAEREARAVSVIMCDLDHFKRLNDEHGHAFGDSVLREAAVTLLGALRETDVVCRYGGEELVVILPDCDIDRAVDKAEVLRLRIEGLSQTHGAAITASFGVASVPQTSASVADLLASADAALYKAKQGGRNQVAAAISRPFTLERLEDQIEAPLPSSIAAE